VLVCATVDSFATWSHTKCSSRGSSLVPQKTENERLISAHASKSCTMRVGGPLDQVWSCPDDPGRFYGRGKKELETISFKRVNLGVSHGCHRHANNESSCEESVPSSRYCTGVYPLNCPWFSCFLTRYSAGKQARQIHPLTDATWVLQYASTVKISTNQSLYSMVHSWPK
jgi:hypothetical protein